MKRTLVVSVFVVLSLWPAGRLKAQPPDCCAEDGLDDADRICRGEQCCSAWRPPLYFRSEGLFLHRDVRGQAVAATEGINPQNVALSTTLFNEPFQGGPELTVGMTLGDTAYGVEFSFFTVKAWEEGASVRDPLLNGEGTPGNLFSPFTHFGQLTANFGIPGRAGFDFNNFVAIHEISDLDSEEFNIVHLVPMPSRGLTVSWLVGLRHLGIHEQFDYLSQSEVPDPAGSSLSLRTRTGNRMWGPQIGGLFEFYAHTCCWVNFEVKGALLQNTAYQDTGAVLNSQGLPPAVEQRRDDTDTAFAADFDLTVVYHPTKWLTARFGYQALWVNGLALASENFSIPADKLIEGPAPIRLSGTVLYHGPHAGIELHW